MSENVNETTTPATVEAPLSEQVSASGSEVRQWLTDNGHTPGKRGRFSADQIKAYNKANSKKYVSGAGTRKVCKVELRIAGRKRTRNYTPALVRAALVAKGVQVGARGRLTAEQIALAFGAETV